MVLKDCKIARYYAERVLERTEEDDWESLEDVYGELIRIYAFLGDMDTSEEYLVKYREIIAKISDENLHNALQEMEVKYDVQQKDLEISRQQIEIKQHKTLRYAFMGGLIAAAVLLALFTYIIILRNKRNRELAEMNSVKDKFFSIISHDLKNPAIAQRDALQLLLDNSRKWDFDSLTKYYQSLLKSANSQVVLLYNLLNWAQIHTGRMVFHPIPFDIIPAIEPDMDLIKSNAEQKGITFQTQIPEETIITGDPNMIAIVIRNLCTNAIKFTHDGGAVTLEIAQNIISVSDTGTGMTPEQLQNLFRMDKKQSKLGTAGEQGSGLGLMVCKELVEKHGSTLHVESEEGKGCRVWFGI
jgi:signal transduction histidine kinase